MLCAVCFVLSHVASKFINCDSSDSCEAASNRVELAGTKIFTTKAPECVSGKTSEESGESRGLGEAAKIAAEWVEEREKI